MSDAMVSGTFRSPEHRWSRVLAALRNVAAAAVLLFAPCDPAARAQASQEDEVFKAFNPGLEAYRAGRYVEARTHFQRAVELAPRAFGAGQRGPTNIDTARLRQFLANAHLECFDLLEAERLYRDCIEVAQLEEGPQSAMIPECYGSLGTVATRLGQWDVAEKSFQQALQTDSNQDNRARTLRNFASMSLLSDQLDKAADRYQQALSFWQEADPERYALDIASCRHGLAFVALKQGKVQDAQRGFAEAAAVRRRGLSANHKFVGHSTEMLGVTDGLLGNPEAAVNRLRDAERIMHAFWGDSHVELAEVEHELALNLARQGEVAGAVESMNRSRMNYRRYLGGVLPGLSQVEQLKFLAAEQHRQMDALAVAAQFLNDSAAGTASLEWVLNGKGLSYEVLAERHLLARDERAGGGAGALAAELASLRRELVALSSSQGDRDAGRLQELTRREIELCRRMGLTTGKTESRWTTLDDLLRHLPRDATLLEFAYVDRDQPSPSAFGAASSGGAEAAGRYLVWVIKGNDRSVRLLDLGPARVINQRIQQLQPQLGGRKGLDKTATATIKAELQSLARMLLGPIGDEVASVRQLLISPDSDLWFVPWNALVLEDRRYLVEKTEVSLVISGRLLCSASSLKPRPYGLIMADPDFDLSSQGVREKIQNPPIPTEKIPASQSRRSANLANVTWPRLDGTRKEAELTKPGMEKYLEDQPVLRYMGANALETFFKGLTRPRLAVIATHGFFDNAGRTADRPSLSCCGLVLAGVNRAGSDQKGADDGLLTGLEVLDCDLRGTELVVLSACETARGQTATGEGVAGLQMAFQLAGADAVMATLWQIPDGETADLMIRFWAQMPVVRRPSTALRAAQLEMFGELAGKGIPPHPYFWAAPQVSLAAGL